MDQEAVARLFQRGTVLRLFYWSSVPQNIDSHRADKYGDHLDRWHKIISPGEQTPKYPHGNGENERPRISRKCVHAFRPPSFGAGHLLTHNSTLREPLVSKAISIDRLI